MPRTANKLRNLEHVDINSLKLELKQVATQLEKLKEEKQLSKNLETDIQNLITSIDQFTNK